MMKKNVLLKRFISFLLCTAMVMVYMPSTFFYVFAEDGGTEGSNAIVEPADNAASVQNDTNDSANDAPDTSAVNAGNSSNEPAAEGAGSDVVSDGEIISDTPGASGNETRAGPENGDGTEENALDLSNGADTLAEADVTALEAEAENAEESWTVTFYNRDAEVHKTVEVKKGDAIGSEMPAVIAREDYHAYWAIGEIVEGSQGHEIRVTGSKIDGSYKPSADTVVVPDYDMISYKVTFLDENKAETIATRTVDANTSYCLNDIPKVPVKNGFSGKWVYGDGDFSNNVTVHGNMEVWAEYEETVYTVSYKYKLADETEKIYQTDKYYKGDTLELPPEPTEEGHEFLGWYVGETKYNGGEAVTSDMVLQGSFKDMYSVKFVVLNNDGTDKEVLSQYFRTEGDTIETMPQDPFVEGKSFVKWVIEGTDTEVTADTVVKKSFRAIAVFDTVDKYTLTAKYWYKADNGEKHTFETVIKELATPDLPYTLTPPASTKTDSSLVYEGPVYYASSTSVKVSTSDFDADKNCEVEIEYVPYTAKYDFVYLLKDLDGNGYTEFDRESDIKGVLGSYVSPTVKEYDYAVFESAEAATIEQAKGQELAVKYSRKTYQLTYETGGGSYVGGKNAPYGTEVELSSTVPTKEGYTFAGWFLDEACTESAGTSITLEKDTTVYAKWNGRAVNYTIVYMFEKYNDAGTDSSYVYDNSRTGTATVGSTVKATDAPTITRTGWEKDNERNAASSTAVAADGSSVLFVYYKLTGYTFRFRPGTYYYSNVTASLNGESRTGNNNYSYTFTAKLGQDISSLWLSAGNGTYGYGGRCSFSGWVKTSGGSVYVTKRSILTEDMLPGSGTTVTYEGYWLTNTVQYTVNYWLQNADNDQYTKSAEYSQTYNYSNNANIEPKDIPGYTYSRRTDSGRTTDFYYNRDRYKIDYFYGSKNIRTINNVKFDASITGGTYNWTPTAAQCGVDSDYTFEGWYADAGLTSKYTFGTMPASNLVLYAKWTAPSFTVSFDLDGGSPAVEDQTVVKNHKAEKPHNPVKNGYTFDGWYTEAEGGQLFDWAKQITEDTVIYAHWTQNPMSYTVHYVKDTADGEKVAPDRTVTNPNWKVGDIVSEKAIAIAGYRPDQGEKTLELAVGDDNEITFIYTEKSGTISYKVRYLLEGTEEDVHAEKTVTDVDINKESVIEFAVAIPDYKGKELYPDAVEKSLTLGADESKNVITFYYSEYKSMAVTVNFVDMNGNEIAGSDKKILKVGNTFTLNHAPVAGYEFNKAVNGRSYSGESATESFKVTADMVAENPDGIEITMFYQKRLTITANSNSKQYDGKALTMPSDIKDQVTVEGLAEGDSLVSISFGFSGNDVINGILNAGVATVTPAAAATAKHASDNYYKIRYISGNLEVTKINVTVRIEPDRWTGAAYTGNPYKAGFTNPGKGIADYIMISHEGYSGEYLDDIWSAVKANTDHDASAAGLGYYGIEEKNAGDYTYNIGLTIADLPEDPNYSVSLYVRPGRLQILPKEATASTASDSKVYDGNALTNSEGSIEGLTEADHGKVSVTGTGSITEPGSTPNTVSINWGDVQPGNYIVTEMPGTLTVSKASPSVTVAPETLVYNGKEQSGKTSYSVTGLIQGHKLEIGYTPAKGTDVSGSPYDNGSFAETFTVTDAEGKDVSGCYNAPVCTAGTLTITPAPLTIVTKSASKAYDGEALTAAGSISGFVNGETATFETTGSQTEVGESDNTYSLKWDGTAKESNYEVDSETIGKLTVIDSDKEIVVTTTGGKFTYDGKAHGATVTVTGLPKGYSVRTAASSATATDVTAKAVAATADTLVIVNAKGDDVTAKLNIKYVDGEITIEPATLTIVTPDAEKTYDGEALTAAGTISGFVNGETAAFETTGSQTEVGDSKNTYSLKWNGSAKKGNYTISETIGTLKVTESTAEVLVKTTGGKFTYDGTAHGATVAVTGLPKGYSVRSAASSATATDVTTKAVAATADTLVIVNTSGADVTSKLNIKYENGEISVTPAALTIVTEDGTKEYDGKALTADGSIEGFVNGETAEFKTTGSQTNVGESDNTYSLTWNGTAKSSNYEIVSETLGKLTVTKAVLPEDPDDPEDPKDNRFQATVPADVVYNGREQKQEVKAFDTATGKELTSADVTITYSSDLTNVGTVTVTVAAKKKGNYSGSFIRTYKITPAPLTIVTESASKEYDGKALTADGSIEGFVNGETAAFKTTGSQTAVGESDNTYSLTWNGTAKSSNYEISSETLGKLTVTKAKLPEDPDDPEDPKDNRFQATVPKDVVYNGKEQKQEVKAFDTATGKELTAADVTITYSKDLTNVGTVTVTVTAAEDSNYSGSFNRTYRILPAEITLKADDKTKVYGQKDPEFTVSIVSGQIFGDDEISYDISRESGENAGQYTIDLRDGSNFILKALRSVKGNYDISFEDGTLTITKAPLTVTTGSGSKTYDGTALTVASAAISGLVNGETATVTATGSQTTVGSSVNTYSINWGSTDANNYEISENLGTLSVISGGGGVIPPGPGPGPGVTPDGPGTTPDGDGAEVPDTPVPQADPEDADIPDNATPLAAGAWALINLIAAILTTLGAIVALLRKKEKEDEEEDDQEAEKKADNEEEDEEDNRGKKMLAAKLAGAVAGIAAPIAFILTEDMSLPMQMIDKWTILMVIILAVQVVAAILNKRASKLDDEEEEEAEPAAN